MKKTVKNKKICSNVYKVSAIVAATAIIFFGVTYAAPAQIRRINTERKRINKKKELVERQNRTGKLEGFEVKDVPVEAGVIEKEVMETNPNPNVASAAGCVSGTNVIWRSFGTDKFEVLRDSGAPRYSQQNSAWATSKYGSSSGCTTYKESGCGPSALASAISAFSTQNVKQVGDFLAKYYPAYRVKYTTSSPCKSGTKSDAMTAVPKHYVDVWAGYWLKGARLATWTLVQGEINNYNPVIIKTSNPCFTTSSHYITIRGKVKRRSDGKIFYWINDSNNTIVLADESTIRANLVDAWVVKTDYNRPR